MYKLLIFAGPQHFVNPTLTYQITSGNLVNSDTLSGMLATLADAGSPTGVYAITHNTLTGGNNYTLTYIGADLTVTPAPVVSGASNGSNPSAVNPQTPTSPQQPVSITLQNQGVGVFNISFTPANIRTANTNTNDVVTASPSSGGASAGNNGRNYPPISQFDANQYSDFKLPDFTKDAGVATIFVMLARAAEQQNA